MENSMTLGLMTVFAVSGSMVLLVHQVHKHMFNNFMKKFESEIRGVMYPHDPKNKSGSTKHQTKKVRFAEDVLEQSMEKKGDCVTVAKAQQVEDEKVFVMDDSKKLRGGRELKGTMPPNRVALYRGIMRYRIIKGRFSF